MSKNASPALQIKMNSEGNPLRKITQRTQGSGHGIVRLVSPSDLGEIIKPFVFLDRVDAKPTPEADVARELAEHYHPHSGIATVTVLLSGKICYEDSTGASGLLPAGGVEYMQAGGGVWHTGAIVGKENAKAFQLWVALPTELENTQALSVYLPPEDVQGEGPVRVILGAYGNIRSRLPLASPMTYLHVRLNDGERWVYRPPNDHDIAWVASADGKLYANGTALGKEVAVFEVGNQEIEFIASGTTDFVLGSAVKHPHSLVLGIYSVHTNRESLEAGRAEIERIGREQGKSL